MWNSGNSFASLELVLVWMLLGAIVDNLIVQQGGEKRETFDFISLS